MTFTWNFKAKFADEFKRLPAAEQDKVIEFTDLYEAHGLADFSKYPGKITQSWKGLDPAGDDYKFTYNNCLWHYHIGLPKYNQSVSGKYLTSDWVLHFQWMYKGSHIALVDLYQHVGYNGKFWLPKPEYLEEPPPEEEGKT